MIRSITFWFTIIVCLIFVLVAANRPMAEETSLPEITQDDVVMLLDFENKSYTRIPSFEEEIVFSNDAGLLVVRAEFIEAPEKASSPIAKNATPPRRPRGGNRSNQVAATSH